MRRLELALAIIIAALCIEASTRCAVGGREQGPSEVLTETARAYSDPALVPAPSDRAEDDGEAATRETHGGDVTTDTPHAPEPASTVTQSALTASVPRYPGSSGAPVPPNAVIVTAIDPVPATPVATPARVETISPQSIKSYEPWPAYLWPTVACIVQRESGGLEWKVSPGGDVGLMQVGPANFEYLAERGITLAMLFDGPTNLRAGWMLYQYWQGVNGDGLTPWKSTRGGCA